MLHLYFIGGKTLGIEVSQSNYTISPEQAKRKSYKKALFDEIALWSKADEDALNKLRVNQPKILAYRKKIMGQKGPVEDFADWTHFLVTDYGPRKRCLSLGSGVGRVEKYLVKTGFAERIETFELCADLNKSVRLTDSKIDTQAADLNFMELQPNSYDFILCHCVLHHLVNLEHVLHMINFALKEDGLFLVYEYVGETRWQFTEQRLDFIRNMFLGLEFKSPPLWSVGGFEAVRSGEILGLIQNQFGDTCKQSVGIGSVYFPFIECTTSEADMHIDKVIELDEMVAKEKTLLPCYHMGLYGKSKRPPVLARRWSDNELDFRLMPPMPLYIRARRILGNSPIGPLLRRAKKAMARQSR